VEPPEPAIVTWYQAATAYAVMKWPSLAAHSRASLAESLATVTPTLTWPGARDRPDQRELRTALYQHAFNPARPADPGSPAVQILDWAQQASLPIGCLSKPAVLRTALEALTLRLDGSRAAANTIIRKRVVLHGALGYAVEAGLLPDNPLDIIAWQVPRSSAALDPVVVANPAQVSRLLDAVAQVKPEMTAFFGCLYYAALRPEEAVALRFADCDLPGAGWGMLRLAMAAPRTAAAWTSSGTSHEQRGLKHRPDGAIRAGHSVAVLLTVYSHCIHGRDDLLNQQIDHVLEPPAGRGPCPSVRKPAVRTDRATPPKGQRLNRPRNPAEKPAVEPTAMGATPSAMRP
jgi:hypothetical protein